MQTYFVGFDKSHEIKKIRKRFFKIAKARCLEIYFLERIA
jgi:hypothetical protein